MIYLASVYSYRPEGLSEEAYRLLIEARYRFVREKTAEFIKQRRSVFSPIVHCHLLSLNHDMPKTWEFWSDIDFGYMQACDELWVLKMPYWELSTGISGEIEYAESMGIPVKYIECPTYSK